MIASVKNRNLSLDFVKGACVVAMVLNHTSTDINPHSNVSYEQILRLVGFVSYAFIFLSGLMIGWYYAQKFEADKVKTTKRLVIRALKLIALVVILNLLIYMLDNVGQPFNLVLIRNFVSLMLESAISIVGQPISFGILFSIAYTLLFGPLILNYIRFKEVMTVVVLTLLVLSEWFLPDLLNNVHLIMVGLAGIMVGSFIKTYPDFFGNRLKIRGWKVVLIWGFLFIQYALFKFIEIQASPLIKPIYLWLRPLLTLLDMLTVLVCLYHLSLLINWQHPIYKAIVIMGSYSLFSYLVQILYVKIFNALNIPLSGYPLFLFVVILTSLGLVVTCRVIDFMRQKTQLINSVYQLVFS